MFREKQKLDRATKVQFLRGVGPRRAELFGQLGVEAVADLLEYYPRNHEFLPPLALINELMENQQATIAGQVCRM